MKTNLIIFLFLLASSCAWGQDEAEKSKSNSSHEVGVNVNALLNQFIFKNTDEFTLAPPDNQYPNLMYRFHKNRMALRVGLGFYYDSERDTVSNSFSTSFNFKSYRNYSTSIGFQKNYFPEKKLNFYLGLDLKYVNLSTVIEQEAPLGPFQPGDTYLSTFTTTTQSVGLGFPIGISFHISDRLNISTEGSLELLGNLRENKTDFDNAGINNSTTDESKYVNVNFKQPLSLFINYRF